MLDFVFTGTDGAAPRSGYDNLLTLSLSAADFSAVNAAPQFVEFEVTNVAGAETPGPNGSVYDPQYHEITYFWDFGDDANATPTTTLNLPAAWKDLNTAYGRRTGHVYKEDGPYTATCYAYEPSTRRFGTATVNVTVGNADTVFAGNRTIIFNPGGAADTSAYPSATIVTTNWDAVVAARNARGATACRILLAPGITIAGRQLAAPLSWSNIRIGPLDPAGTKPVIGPRGKDGGTRGDEPFIRDWSNACKESVYYGLSFVGDWDSTTQLGHIHEPFSVSKSGYVGNYQELWCQCDFSGLGAVKAAFVTGPNMVLRSAAFECDITNWQDYGFYSQAPNDSNTYVIGCRIEQHPDALSGGQKITMTNQHACIRIMKSDHLGVRSCSLFSRNGWSIGGTLDGYKRSTVNAALRINAGSKPNSFSYIDRCAIEGDVVIQEEDRTGNLPGNHVVDKVVSILGADLVDYAYEVRHGGTTLRNLLIVKLGVQEAVDVTRMKKLISFSSTGGIAGNADTPQKVYNNTFIDLRTNAQLSPQTFQFIEELGIFSDFTVVNNVTSLPNRTPADNPDAPIDLLTSIGVVSKGKGPRYDFLITTGTIATAITNGNNLVVPYSQITESRWNHDLVAYGPATTQAYWTANELVDTRHTLRINDVSYRAEDSQLSVVFGTTGAIITNLSGTDWVGGFRLKLDRTSRLPAFNPAFSTVGVSAPTGRPLTGSDAIGDGDTGLAAYDDLFGTERPATGDTRGSML